MIFRSISFLAFCLKNGIFLQNHENFFLKNTMKNFPHIKKKIVAWTILVSRHQMTFYFVLCIIITRNRNLIMVSKSVGHQFQTKLKTSVGFTVTIFLNHATTTIVIITTQILKILRLLKLKN